jgi:hypothetical protein
MAAGGQRGTNVKKLFRAHTIYIVNGASNSMRGGIKISPRRSGARLDIPRAKFLYGRFHELGEAGHVFSVDF